MSGSDLQIRGNIECEIFGSLLEEAKDSYNEDIVFERRFSFITGT